MAAAAGMWMRSRGAGAVGCGEEGSLGMNGNRGMKPSKFDQYFQIGDAVVNTVLGFGGYIKDIDEDGIYIIDPDGDIIYACYRTGPFCTGPEAKRRVEKGFCKAR
jgi:hypothetical protein